MFRYGSLSCFWLSESIRFVVNVIKDVVSLVGALNQVAGFVVSVAAVDGAAGQRVLFAAECWCAAPDGTLAF